MSLAGKVALVTGSTSGIGEGIARALAAEGADVMLNGFGDAGQIEALRAAMASQYGVRVGYSGADISKADEIAGMVAATQAQFGSLDILVNNAATNPYFGRLIDIDAARAEKTVAVNQNAYLTWTQAAWRAGLPDGGGVVINVSSVGALSVEPGIGWYNVTKAAVAHLTRQLAGELGPAVRVNALAPGLVKTDFAKALWERHEEQIAGRLPLRRLGVPDDVATAALFLASDAASWITGHMLVVDGGAMVVPSGGI